MMDMGPELDPSLEGLLFSECFCMQQPLKRGWPQHKILMYEYMFVRCVRRHWYTKHFLHIAPNISTSVHVDPGNHKPL